MPRSRELTAWLRLTRRLPPLPRALGLVEHIVRPFYLRKPRPIEQMDVLGAAMQLDPAQGVDGPLIFAPHLVDRHERHFLEPFLGPGSTFVDLGAHIGLYTLWAAQRVGGSGRVIAVEAAPDTFLRLRANLALNPDIAARVRPLNLAVSDRSGTAHLGFARQDNVGGHSLLKADAPGVKVPTLPLDDLVRAERVDRIDAMKLDLEGLEYRVLDAYFQANARARWPRAIVVEHHPGLDSRAGGDVLALLRARRFVVTRVSRHNWTARRQPA